MKNKKVLMTIISIVVVMTLAAVTVCAISANNHQTDTFGNGSVYNTYFFVSDAIELRAYGNVKNKVYPNYSLRIAINAGASYLSGGTAGGSDNGYGYMGNPGRAEVIVQLDDYCEWAFAEYHLHENGVYILTVGDSC